MIFENNDLIPALDVITRELVGVLPSDLADPNASDKQWTAPVLRCLEGLGHARGLMVCCHGCKDNGEWLLDSIWMVRERHEIVLAVESEWGALALIEDDFDKLMSVKSPRKLMLFCTKDHQGADGILRKLEANMRAYPYHLAGEEYVLLEVTRPGAFRYHFRVPATGRLDSVSFSQMGEPLRWPWASAGE